jgi:hypothetical protein
MEIVTTIDVSTMWCDLIPGDKTASKVGQHHPNCQCFETHIEENLSKKECQTDDCKFKSGETEEHSTAQGHILTLIFLPTVTILR